VAKHVKRVAKKMGAKVVERLPDVGAGTVGAMRMAMLLQSRLQPGQGVRPGRPSVPTWTRRPKVPMSEATENRLAKLAKLFSRQQKHPVTPMQVAAHLLEAAVASYSPDQGER
jgi:hypothetical protein